MSEEVLTFFYDDEGIIIYFEYILNIQFGWGRDGEPDIVVQYTYHGRFDDPAENWGDLRLDGKEALEILDKYRSLKNNNEQD